MADRDRQRLPETADQQIGPVDASRTQKSPNFAMIIGIPLLLLVLVGGSILLYTNGIFPFSKNSSGGKSNTSNTSNSSGSTGAIVNGRGCTKIGVQRLVYSCLRLGQLAGKTKTIPCWWQLSPRRFLA